MMTATQDEQVAERARAAGAAVFLKKPFFPADIDAVLLGIYGLRASAQSWQRTQIDLRNLRKLDCT
jgi:CheY-like chemotaxis protein